LPSRHTTCKYHSHLLDPDPFLTPPIPHQKNQQQCLYKQLALQNVVLAGTRTLFPLDLIAHMVYAARPYWPAWIDMVAEYVAYDDAAKAGG
jgi:hypothetical protein